MKKRIGLALLLLAFLLPCLAQAASYAVVTQGKLNLRERASASSRSLGRYSSGTWIRLEGDPTGGWYPVSAPDGKRGYMAGNYLTFSSGGSQATVRYAQGGYVNLRSGPSLDTAVVIRVNSGTPVSILSVSGEWDYVSLTQYGQSYTGFIHSSLINRGMATATIVTRNGGKVNVRSGPSFSYGSIGSLPTGTQVNILLKGTGWYWISSGSITGFMSAGYLSESGGALPTPTVTSTPRPDVGYTTAWVNNPKSTQVLNLRQSPSQAARSLGQYYNGKEVHVVSYGSDWSEVYVDGIHGWMMTRYLTFARSAATPVPAYNPNPYVEFITPVPTATPKPASPSYGPTAGQTVYLAPAAGGGSAISVYNDAMLTSLKATYSSGKEARMLQYGDNVCMIFIDGGVGYVSTWNVNY